MQAHASEDQTGSSDCENRAQGAKSQASLLLIGSSFRVSRLDFRERLAGILPGEPAHLKRSAMAKECALLVTCNRIEILFVTDDAERTKVSFFSWFGKASGKRELKGSRGGTTLN